ncbi:uncharacterized protein LOC120414128 [Culex pipiens pallens]|uniref:uncharacterized protein LOC120414128 n=1 Tax=Culex pipiens pallens TaxID=42434 RepID=UPI0022AA4CD8|nr:uncharacterized protein LOC120414128 [Culex pipiens pallens]
MERKGIILSSGWKLVLARLLTTMAIWSSAADASEARKSRALSNFAAIRDGRFLPIFTVFQWGQGLCSASSGEYGSCQPNNECVLRGGIPAGPCAGGYGTCCIFMASCGGVARENGTYFVNPNHPDTTDGTGSCQLTVLKMHPDICQIRLDFDQFSINGPEIVNHICNNDQFLVSGGSPAPTICGTSNGDHMYIDAGMGQSNPIILTVITSGPSYPRSWRVRISQIPCGAISKAEQGCLQYFTGVSGRIKSFNFDTTSGRQLSNQDYSLCIRTERNFCSIHYTACPDVSRNRSRTFTLSGNSNMAVQAMVGGGTQGAPNSCMHDWLLIPCAKVADRMPTASTCEDKICGGVFNAEVSSVERTVVSTVRPFHLAFHTDSVEAPMDVDNRGFCLDYVQQPCTSN